MKNKKVFISLLFLLIFSLGFFLANRVLADGLITPATGTSDCQKNGLTAEDCGDYTVDDFVYQAILISQWVLGIVGSLTLLMFIYGGFIFLISAGSSEKISQAKKIITAAVVGLIIVFSSWLIINFVFKSLNLDWKGKIETPEQITE